MTDCTEWQLLLQADLDGELSPAEAARLAAHEAGCAACASLRKRLSALSARIAQEAPRYEAPAALRAALQAAVVPAPQGAVVVPFRPRARRWTRETIGFVAGAALAASVTFAVFQPATTNPADQIIADHIRALQPGHLIDVESSDHHTVKPWFDGRIDFAPPVPQFERYPLLGGRLDYAAGHTMAALSYRAGKHIVDVFIRPADANATAREGTREGYHYICWLQGGMVLWAVSDMDPTELANFVQAWKDT
ncbi:MAG TPA: zf-HC2 domain-containing protein [Acidisphaera sp.]|nr:zf-HC2 domain-containing protein [Acidisphaera sp.]